MKNDVCDVCGGKEMGNTSIGTNAMGWKDEVEVIFGKITAKNGYSIRLCVNCENKFVERLKGSRKNIVRAL